MTHEFPENRRFWHSCQGNPDLEAGPLPATLLDSSEPV